MLFLLVFSPCSLLHVGLWPNAHTMVAVYALTDHECLTTNTGIPVVTTQIKQLYLSRVERGAFWTTLAQSITGAELALMSTID